MAVNPANRCIQIRVRLYPLFHSRSGSTLSLRKPTRSITFDYTPVTPPTYPLSCATDRMHGATASSMTMSSIAFFQSRPDSGYVSGNGVLVSMRRSRPTVALGLRSPKPVSVAGRIAARTATHTNGHLSFAPQVVQKFLPGFTSLPH